MTTTIDQMAEIYCFVDDFLKAHPELAGWRSSPNSEPAFTDSEVITVGLMQRCFGVPTLKQAYQRIRNDYAPPLPFKQGGWESQPLVSGSAGLEF